METLYRKVAVTKQDLIEYLRSQYEQKKEYDCMPENDEGFEYISDSAVGKIVDGLIPMVKNFLKSDSDKTAQLQADKAELLEALDALNENYKANNEDACEHLMSLLPSLIKKHKQ